MKLLLILMFTLSFNAYAGDNHDHDEEHSHQEDSHDEENHTATDDHDEHKDDHKHEDGHGDHESSSVVGHDKGITEKSENGFKLSSEAIKSMEIKTQTIQGSKLSIDKKTLVSVKDEKSVFRIRDGWIKRIPVQILNHNQGLYNVTSTLLQVGDQIVIQGTGFLRTAEIFATEGASHGHSH